MLLAYRESSGPVFSNVLFLRAFFFNNSCKLKDNNGKINSFIFSFPFLFFFFSFLSYFFLFSLFLCFFFILFSFSFSFSSFFFLQIIWEPTKMKKKRKKILKIINSSFSSVLPSFSMGRISPDQLHLNQTFLTQPKYPFNSFVFGLS